MRHLMYFLILLISFSSYGQTIKGRLSDGQASVLFANVMLYEAIDSTLQKFTYSEDDGTFVFDQIPKGQYYITTSFVGLQDYSSPLISLDQDIDLGTYMMTTMSNNLEEVVVTAKKPLMEVKADKVVLNVAGSVLSTGDDALNLLRKAPGVVVDNNENISLMGKSGLIIYIDGKPSPLTATELATMLKNMQSSDIESIEIISNPSAKYEAQGTAGIINIKRKKLKGEGLNGTVNGSFRQGITQGVNGGLSLNYRNDKFNLFGNGGYFDSHNLNYNDFYREQNDLGFQTINENRNHDKGYNAKLSGDYYLSKKSTLGFIAEHNADDSNSSNVSTTTLGNVLLTNIDSLLLNNGNNVSDTKNTNLNLNYYFDGGNETTFNIDANYGRYSKTNNAYTPNVYTTPDQSEITSTYEVRSVTPTDIDIASFKMDYERKLGKGKISGGLKSALVGTDNTFNFFNIVDDVEIINQRLSNTFKYNEWVNAGYVNYNTQINKLGINLGLRVENSNTKGELIAMNAQNDKTVERHYTNVFPSAGLSYVPSEKHSFQLSYGKRINRPNYQDLNPFEFQLDQLTFEKGNAFLNPEYTDNIQLTHTFASKLTTTLSYSHTSDVITRLVDTSGLKGTFITWDNIAYRKTYNLSMSAPFSFSNKWSTYTNINGTHTINKADFGDGKVININVTSFNLYHQQSYSFNHGWSAEVSGWYSTPSIWEGTFRMSAMGALGAGVSKKFSDGRSKITLTIDDIFKTNVWSGVSRYGGLYMDITGGWDSRRARVSYSYNFGKQSKSASRRRSTGFEEEQQRIKK